MTAPALRVTAQADRRNREDRLSSPRTFPEAVDRETEMRKTLAGGLLGSLVLTLAMVGGVSAAPGGNTAGDTLVNVQISGLTILVPVAVAANLCDINVNVVAAQFDAGDTVCTATAESAASPGWNNGGNGGNQAGNSLVNVQITNVDIVVPIALAANLCDVNANVLALQIRTGDAECTATATSLAS
jgi:hypothetical protein